MKLRDITNFDKFEKNEFFVFLISLITVGLVAYVLSLNSSNDATFVGWYAFCGGTFLVCFSVYIFPVIRDKYSTTGTGKYRPDPHEVLLIGIDGSRPVAKKRALEDIIRRNKI